MPLKELTPDSLEELRSSKAAVVEAWAVWCQPCKLISPIVEELAKDYSDRGVVFYRFNAEDYPDLLSELGILSIPTVLFMKDGREVARTVGLASKKALEGYLSKILEE